MVTSDKQLEANRRNAQASTGPTTEQGKKSSRKNALKHGLTAETVVAIDEDPEKYDLLVESVFEVFQPGSPMEDEIVERIASYFWRLRRVPQIEAGLISNSHADSVLEMARIMDAQFSDSGGVPDVVFESEFKRKSFDSDDEVRRQAAEVFHSPQGRLAEAFRWDAKHGDGLARLSRYEATLTRQLERALALFGKLKTQRLDGVAGMKDITGELELSTD